MYSSWDGHSGRSGHSALLNPKEESVPLLVVLALNGKLRSEAIKGKRHPKKFRIIKKRRNRKWATTTSRKPRKHWSF